MTKNILVTDENGTNYGTTYPKRAAGLVKHGRARFVDDTTICLACPPNINITEDNMSDTTAGISRQDILYRIENILNDKPDFNGILAKINEISMSAKSPDCAGEVTAEAIKSYLLAHEETKQQSIRLLERMYDDLVRSEQESAGVQRRRDELFELNDVLRCIVWDELHDESKLIMRQTIQCKFGAYIGQG